MFDPKILLEAMLSGAAKPASGAPAASAIDLGEILRRMGGAPGQAPQGGGGLSDILEKLAKAAQQGQGGGASQPQAGGGGLGDILGQIFGRAAQQPGPGAARPAGGPPPAGGTMDDDEQQDQDQDRQQERGGQARGPAPSSSGGGDLLEEIFGKKAGAPPAPQPPSRPMQPQPTQAPEAPQAPWVGGSGGARPGGAMDARHRAEELLSAIAAGQGTPEMIAELQQMAESGQINASAVIGGLGNVIVGNKPGRRINAEAVRMGGLELIGAIAYTSYTGYQTDRGGRVSQTFPNTPAPKGSGFEPQAQTSDTALLYVRAMIAAAMSDGEIDAGEQQQLVGGLEALGLGQHAAQFLQQEMENQASIQDLVQAAGAPAVALQAYVAARLAIEPDTRDEQAFLQALAQGFGIDASLAAHIDAQTTALKA